MRNLYIAGQRVDFLRKWSFTETLGSSSTFSATILPPAPKPQLYQRITLQDHQIGSTVRERNVFDGIITKVTPVQDGTLIVYNVSAADYSRVADYRLISAAAINMTAENIVTQKLLPLLAGDGITAGTISANITVKKAVFNFCKVSDALTQLATLCGSTYTWYIKNKQLHFGQREQNVSGYTLDDDVRVKDFKYSASADAYRNIQYVKGSKGWTLAQTETLTVSGKDYTTRYPVALQPSISVNGVPATVGVSGLNDGTADFFWSYDSRTITCNLETAPGTISITYIGLMTIYTRKTSPSEITRVAGLSGGSGIREALYADDTIDTQDAAAQYCDALLAKYARDAEKITFTTEVDDYWHVGELVYVFKRSYGIAGYYLVTERKGKGTNADNYEYELTLSGGSDYDGWIRFFDELAQRPAGSVINADEIAIVMEDFDEDIYDTGYTTIQVLEYQACSASLICSTSLLLGTITSSATIGDTIL